MQQLQNHLSSAPDVERPSGNEAVETVQMKQQLAGMTYDQQVQHLQPAMPVMLGAAAPPVQMKRDGGEAPVQMKADDPVQFRNAKAERAFGGMTLGGTPTDDAHMFEGEVTGGDPKGLHAYTAGVAGSGCTVLKTLGNVNSVHTVIWSKGSAVAAGRAKFSSMMPKQMSKGIVCFYVQGSPGAVDGSKRKKPERPGTGWNTITMATAGDTVYPVGGPSYQDACTYHAVSRKWQIVHSGRTYNIVN